MNIGAFISNIVGNVLSFSVMVWLIFSYKIDKNEIVRAFIGVVMAFKLAPLIGVILISFTTPFITNPEKSLALLIFISTSAEELMKCVLYILLFKGIQRVPTLVLFGLLFGSIEVFLVGNYFSYPEMFGSNVHFFLHPSFLLIMYYFASKSNFKDTKVICFGVFLAIVTHLLNNFQDEYFTVLYPYYFSALMIFSYKYIKSDYKKLRQGAVE
jgi:hypothetical protein